MMQFSTEADEKNLTIKLNNEQNYKNNKVKNQSNLKLMNEKKSEINNTFLCKSDHFCVGPYSKLNNDAFDK